LAVEFDALSNRIVTPEIIARQATRENHAIRAVESGLEISRYGPQTYDGKEIRISPEHVFLRLHGPVPEEARPAGNQTGSGLNGRKIQLQRRGETWISTFKRCVGMAWRANRLRYDVCPLVIRDPAVESQLVANEKHDENRHGESHRQTKDVDGRV